MIVRKIERLKEKLKNLRNRDRERERGRLGNIVRKRERKQRFSV